MVDWFAFKPNLTKDGWFQESSRDLYPKAFLFELALALHERATMAKTAAKSAEAGSSLYHVKATVEPTNSHDNVKQEQVYHL